MAEVNPISLAPTPAELAKKIKRERSETNRDWLDGIAFTAKQENDAICVEFELSADKAFKG